MVYWRMFLKENFTEDKDHGYKEKVTDHIID